VSDVKPIPQSLGVDLDRILGRHGARYFKDLIDAINTKIDEITAATQGNVAVFDSNGRVADGGFTPLQGSLTASRLAYIDANSVIRSVLDLSDWIAVANDIGVADDGDGSITLSRNIAYGSLYLHEGAINVDISTPGQGTYVKITGLTSGLTNNITINSDAFNVAYPGIYKVNWQISGDSQGLNKTYEIDIFVNGVEQSDGSARREFGAADSLGCLSGTAILNITSASHDIDIRMEEPGAGAGTDFDIFHANFNISLLKLS
jgi:hypothetical protein